MTAIKRDRNGWTPAQRATHAARMRRKYEAGSSIRDLAAETGWSYHLVRTLLAEAGTAIRH